MQIARILLTFSGLLLLGACERSLAADLAAPRVEIPRCELCGQSITKHFFKIPGLSEYYCEKCHQISPKCAFCSRPFVPAGDVESVCPRCQADAVLDPKEAEAAFARVRDWLRENLEFSWSRPIRVRMTRNLPDAVGIEGESGLRELGAFVREGESGTIVLLEGLPRDLLIETLAHELAHAWQAENCPPKLTLLRKEGFAQWVAAKALKGFGCMETLAILEHREDLYGRGYRMIRDLESKSGRRGVFSAVREGR